MRSPFLPARPAFRLSARPALGGAVLIGLVVAPLLSACSSTDSAAATVNGVEISIDALDAELDVIAEEDDFREILEEQFGTPYEGEGEGNVTAAFVASVLNEQVFYELIEQALETLDATVEEEDRDASRTTFTTSDEETAAIFEGLPEDYQDTQVERRAQVQKLNEVIQETAARDEVVERYFDEHPEEFADLLCLRHVLVGTQGDAAGLPPRSAEEATALAGELRAEIEGGADFAAVAQRSSDDASSTEGGSLGCQPASTYVAAFAEAASELDEGELSQPVATEFGVHLILRDEPDLEGARAAVVEATTRIKVEETFADVEVDVNPRYGTWSEPEEGGAVLGRVVPPEGPTTTTTAPSRLVDE